MRASQALHGGSIPLARFKFRFAAQYNFTEMQLYEIIDNRYKKGYSNTLLKAS